MKLGKLWIFGTPPQIWNISLKHLKLPKNHFKTNLFFVHLKHLKFAFTFGEKNKNMASPPLVKKSTFWIMDFWFPEVIHPFWTFSTFWDIFLIQWLPLSAAPNPRVGPSTTLKSVGWNNENLKYFYKIISPSLLLQFHPTFVA